MNLLTCEKPSTIKVIAAAELALFYKSPIQITTRLMAHMLRGAARS
jgi:hypothetical protein